MAVEPFGLTGGEGAAANYDRQTNIITNTSVTFLLSI